ncbi:DUF6424 family protein [Streptomyces sp. NPDC047043]|uniref:DUF6424 family protein n=1 Tax=Streptomyces sp. NPDC047043 TaxID=3154497 RepID=UPI0034040771
MARAGSATAKKTAPALPFGQVEREDHPWAIQLVKHSERSESAHFRAAKEVAHKILDELAKDERPYGPGPYEMHHGGSLWVRTGSGWRMFRARVGIEWSMQFCADPAKIERLRQEAADLVAAFPDTLPALEALGYKRARKLLDTPITDADGVAAWTDSLFNACVPLTRGHHQGILPTAAGEHHYPWPIKGADYIRYDDFNLWVTLPDGTHAAVAPVSARGSGDGHLRIVHARHGTPAGNVLAKAQRRRLMAVLPPDSPMALEAFQQQIPPGARTASGRPRSRTARGRTRQNGT